MSGLVVYGILGETFWPSSMHESFVIAPPPSSSHKSLGVSGGHLRLWDWEVWFISCYRKVQGVQGVFCAKFFYSRIGWPPYQEYCHGYCFSDKSDREPYYYGLMEGVDGTPWNYNPKEELRHKHLANGVHLFITFLSTACHF